MANASDLEHWQLQSRGTSPWLVAIFIVLAAFGGTVCYLLYAKTVAAERQIASLNKFIKADILQPLREAGTEIKPGSKYGKKFFKATEQFIREGVRHRAYAELVGWGTRKEILDAMGADRAYQGATDLRDYHRRLSQTNSQHRTELTRLQTELQKARDGLKQIERQTKQLSQDLQKQITAKVAELDRLKRGHSRELDGLRGQGDSLEQARVRGEIDGQRNQLAEAKAVRLEEAEKFKVEIAKLTREVERLQEIEAKLPGSDGRILKVDNRMAFAVIDIGERDTVEVGERFAVYELTKAGGKRPKGEAIVRSADEKTSRVGITKVTSALNPILAGDFVKRKVLRRKYEIEARAKRREAAEE